MWFNSSGLHSSWAVTVRSRCAPYVCWFYYKPSGNQWPKTHLGAHPLVISLISLLALAIWVLSPRQWLSVPCDWSSSSYRSLINASGWGYGSFLFPSLFFSFFSPLLDCSAGAWCIGCFQEVYRMTDTSRRGGRLAGRAIVNRTGIWHGQYTKKYQLAAYNHVITIDFVLWEMCIKNQSILLENHHHHSLLGDLLLDSSLAHVSP